jgi:hypothetical protein
MAHTHAVDYLRSRILAYVRMIEAKPGYESLYHNSLIVGELTLALLELLRYQEPECALDATPDDEAA